MSSNTAPEQILDEKRERRRAYLKAYYRRMRDAWLEKKQAIESSANVAE